MSELRGYFAALLTPFTDDGARIDGTTLGDLVVHDLNAGLDGLYVGGSTGEAFLLSLQERETILRLAAEATDGRGTLIAQVGDPNPQISAHLARLAADLGYHAISAVPPFYYRYGFEEIRRHYAWLAGQTDLPFIVYNFPDLSGVRLSAAQLAQLLETPGIVGVKNTCGDLYAFERLRRRVPDKVLLHGFDETLAAGLALGADGGIGSTYNVHAHRILAIAEAHRSGRPDEVRALQAQANELIDVLVEVGVLPGLKYLLGLMGMPMGDCRPPFAPLSPADKKKLDAVAANHLSEPSNGSIGQTARG